MDYILFAQIFTLFVDWGSRRYTAHFMTGSEEEFASRISNSLISRIPVFILIQAFIWTAPFSATIIEAISLWIFCKWIGQSYESWFTFKNKDFRVFLADFLAFSVTLCFLIYMGEKLRADTFILALAYGQLAKLIALIVQQKVPWRHFRGHFQSGYYMASFPYFALVFSSLCQYLIDRYFVFILTDDTTKGIYQIYITLVYFAVIAPSFLIYPVIKKLNLPIRSSYLLWLTGLVLIPAWVLFAMFLCNTVYTIALPVSLFLPAVCYAGIAFAGYPFYFAFSSKNRQLLLSICHVLAATGSGVVCYFVVPHWSMEGAVWAAAFGQLILCALVIILYYLEKQERRPILEFS